MQRFVMERFAKPDSDGHAYRAERADTDALDFEDVSEVVHAWCIEHFGPHPDLRDTIVGSRWCGETVFWFRDETDALHFKLRWC